MPNSDHIRIRITAPRDQRAAFVEEMTRGVARINYLRHDSDDHAFIECTHGLWRLSFIDEVNLDAVTRRFPQVKVEVNVLTDWTELYIEMAWQNGHCGFFRSDLLGELPEVGVPVLGDEFHASWPTEIMQEMWKAANVALLGGNTAWPPKQPSTADTDPEKTGEAS